MIGFALGFVVGLLFCPLAVLAERRRWSGPVRTIEIGVEGEQ